MRVLLGADLFAEQGHITQLDVLSLFRHGRQGRHDIVVEARAQGALRAWASELAPRTRQEVMQAQWAGVARRTDSRVTITIDARRRDDWLQRRFTVETGTRLMEMPLALMVENWVNEGAFLRALLAYVNHVGRLAGRARQAECEQVGALVAQLLARGWAIFDHGGGTATMQQRLITLEEGDDLATVLRLWVMTDQDGCAPQVCAAADRLFIPRHMLRRLEIENYLPFGRLEAHIDADPQLGQDERQRRRNNLAALRGMTYAERCQCDMKGARFGNHVADRYNVRQFPAREWDDDPAPQGADVLDEALAIFGSILARR